MDKVTKLVPVKPGLNPMARTSVYILGEVNGEIKEQCTHGTINEVDVSDDCYLANRVIDFKYAAERQRKVLIVDMVPRWKTLFLWILGVQYRRPPNGRFYKARPNDWRNVRERTARS